MPENNNTYQNLWELMSHGRVCREHVSDRKRDDFGALQVALGKVARYTGQEISIEAKPDGWEIKVFSCYAHGQHDEPGEKYHRVIIFIPEDGALPPTVLEEEY